MHVKTKGTLSIAAFAATKQNGALEAFEYLPEPMGPHDVEIEIEYCGVCHSDVHLVDNDWGISQYPLVPGHEVIGTVHDKGGLVQHLKIGQRVGLGWQRSACLECESCKKGDENLCSRQKATCVGHHGGFAQEIRTDARFVFPIPDGLDSANAAPLLCGGITVFSPLSQFTTPYMRVGIIGVGGLGHLAIQFARAMGCEVTAFSSSSDKETEAKKFGASRFVASNNPAKMESCFNTLDFILSTATADLDWELYLRCLKADGKLCFVGIPPKPLTINIGSLLGGRKSIVASPIGSRTTMEHMLTFAARHKIQAQIEVLPMKSLNDALTRVRKNKARYRMVLKNEHEHHHH